MVYHRSFLDLLRQHKLFIILFSVFLIISFSLEAYFSKFDLFVLTNQYHSPFFDRFFKIITCCGDGFTMLAIGIGLCFIRYRYSLITIVAYVYTSIITQLLKMVFHAERPSKFFEGKYDIRTVPGYATHAWNSFPSGHSVSAFALSVVLLHLLSYRYRVWFIFPSALLIIFSRVYLAQHFFQDIVAGSILGTVLTFQVIWYLENTAWYHLSKLDGKLFQKEV